MRNIVFVRHGESEYNVLQARPNLKRCTGAYDTPLTKKGVRQGVEAGTLFAGRGDIQLEAAVSSCLSRAIDTRKNFIAQLGYHVICSENPLWNERSLGSLEGQLETEVFSDHPEYKDDARYLLDYTMKVLGGENLTEVQNRAEQALKEVMEVYSGDIAIFTHAHVLRTMFHSLLTIPKHITITMKVPNATPIIVQEAKNGSFTLEDENILAS